MSGIGSLCRHRISNRSSIKPSRIAVNNDNSDERYRVSYISLAFRRPTSLIGKSSAWNGKGMNSIMIKMYRHARGRPMHSGLISSIFEHSHYGAGLFASRL